MRRERRGKKKCPRPRQSPSPPPAPPFAPGGLSLTLRVAARAFSMPSSSRAQEKVAHARSAASRVLLRIREAFDRALTVLGLGTLITIFSFPYVSGEEGEDPGDEGH